MMKSFPFTATVKLCFTCCYVLFGNVSLHAQGLTRPANGFRHGDSFTRVELEYKSSGRSGRQVVWDFSTLAPLDHVTTGVCRLREDTGEMHVSFPEYRYRYRQQDDSLWCVGYNAPNLWVNYLRPELRLTYPFVFGDSICSLHYGEGQYSHRLHFATYGLSHRKADATGTLLLPDGDTLRHVTRIHERSLLGQKLSLIPDILSRDSTAYSSDSLLHYLRTDSVLWIEDTYRWYARGYRYPVFETTVTAILRSDGTPRPAGWLSYFPDYLPEEIHDARSFCYPYDGMTFEEQDEENERLRQLLPDDALDGELGEDNTTPSPCYTYNYSINPNATQFYLELFCEQEVEVELLLSTVQGYVLGRTPKRRVNGMLHESFDLTPAKNLPTFTTLCLTLIVNGEVRTEKINTRQTHSL